MPIYSRRRFLGAALGLGSALSLGVWSASRGRSGRNNSGESQLGEASHKLHRVHRRSHALGSAVNITVLHADAEAGQAAIAAAFAELERVEDLMSIYRPHSQLSQLNRHGFLRRPHPYLVQVLRQATEISQWSAGGFDVSVQPLWRLYAEAHKEGRQPTPAQVAAARGYVNWEQIKIADDHLQLGLPGMEITLNGIAQGFAADRVLAVLADHGVEHALIDSGELASLGVNEAGRPWTAGIQHPRQPDAYVALARLDGRSLATSGDYASRFSSDFRDHHLLDPHSGQSATSLASVSVAAPTGMLADALSTALFVLGPQRGLKLVERIAGVDAFLVTTEDNVLQTPGFPSQPV